MAVVLICLVFLGLGFVGDFANFDLEIVGFDVDFVVVYFGIGVFCWLVWFNL